MESARVRARVEIEVTSARAREDFGFAAAKTTQTSATECECTVESPRNMESTDSAQTSHRRILTTQRYPTERNPSWDRRM